MRPCFTFRLSDTAKAASTLSIYDEIGFWGVQAADFRTQLSAVKSDDIDVEINSPGGDVFAGVAIYNMLKLSGKKINVKVMGVAASAASLIAMAGDTIQMPKNTFMMVHNPWGVSMGNSDEMRETADLLDKIGGSMLATYAAKTGLPDDALKEMLAVDTWMTADEALASGFATEVIDAIEAKAAFDMTRADLPDHVKAVYASVKPVDPPVEKTPEQLAEEERVAAQARRAASPDASAVHDLAVKAGLTDHANFIAVAATSLEDGERRVKAAKEIVAVATFAKRPAAEISMLVRSGKTVAEARTEIMTAMAAEDVHTSTTKPATQPATMAGAKSPEDAYAARAAAKLARKASPNR